MGQIGGSGGGGGGSLYVHNVVGRLGTGVGGLVFQDAGSNVVTAFNASGNDITLSIRSTYPRVSVLGSDFDLPRVGEEFAADIDVTLTGSGVITYAAVTPDGGVGASNVITATVVAPPTITALSFSGGYPGAQTELKAGDAFQCTITVDQDVDQITVQDLGAGDAAVIPVVGTENVPFNFNVTIADRGNVLQALAATVTARSTGTGSESTARATNQLGGSIDGVDLVNLNNLFPTVSIDVINYPGGQGAVKTGDSVSIDNSASDFDTLLYDSPNGDFTVAADGTFADPKPLTLAFAGGTINEVTNNIRMTATRAANDAQTVVQDIVLVQDAAPTIDLSGLPARCRSGGNDGTSAQVYPLTITSNMQLAGAPTLSADSGGSRGSLAAATGGPSVWTANLTVDETAPDEKGAFTFEGLSATSLSGLAQNAINSGAAYVLGGFVQRTLVVPSFAATVPFGTEVVDFTRLQAGNFSPGGPSVKQPIGTTADTVNGYTIDAVGVNPTTLELLDQAAIAANQLGLYNLSDLEETI